MGFRRTRCICVVTDRRSSSSLSSTFFSPSTCPISPPGFGTGHSRFGVVRSSASLMFLLSSLMTSLHVSSLGILLRRRLGWPVKGSGFGESASVRGSTGHGRRCGVATTRKDTMRVVVKSDMVDRDRGWRCGGMVVATERAAEASQGRGSGNCFWREVD